jgi:chromosome segregation ATPase
LKKFNLFEDDEKKIREFQEYIFDLQKKLERKVESISRLDYKNRKLNEQIQNKTASAKNFGLSHISDTDKNKLKNNFANSMASNEMVSDIDKYKNILEQLNDSNKRETKLHNEIIQLKTQLKKKEEFESGIPQDLKNIENRSIDSGFLDEDLKESTNVGMFNFIKESNNNINNKKDIIISTRSEKEKEMEVNGNDTFNYKAAEQKADEFLREGAGDESDFNEIKQMQKQMKFLKDQLKDCLLKYEQLSEQVKEMLKNVKCDIKIKPQISQICQILGYSPQTTSRILNNKKGGILGLIKGK